MPLKDARASRGPKAQITTFIEDCGKVWGNATRLVVSRKARPKETTYEAEVVVLKGEGGIVVDDSRACVEEFVRQAESDVEKNGAGEYQFTLIGMQELPIRGRRKVTDQEPIALKQTPWIRFGDADGDEGEDANTGGVRGILREAGKMVATVSTAVQAIAAASNTANDGLGNVIDIQKKVIEAQGQAFVSIAAVESKHTESQLALEGMKIDFEKWKFEQQREEERYRENRDDARAQATVDAQQKAEFIGFAKDAITGLITLVAEERKAKREAESGAAHDTTASSSAAAPEPPSTVVRDELAAALADLTEETHAKLTELFGRTKPHKPFGPTYSVWEIVVGAAKQKNDNDTIQTMANIGTAIASQVNAAARASVEQELLTRDQAQSVLDTYRRIAT